MFVDAEITGGVQVGREMGRVATERLATEHGARTESASQRRPEGQATFLESTPTILGHGHDVYVLCAGDERLGSGYPSQLRRRSHDAADREMLRNNHRGARSRGRIALARAK
jgi:hypothetical protein